MGRRPESPQETILTPVSYTHLYVYKRQIPGMVLGLAFLFAFTGTSQQNTFLSLVLCNVVHFFTTPYLMGKSCLLYTSRCV